jgi:hypothetical protein
MRRVFISKNQSAQDVPCKYSDEHLSVDLPPEEPLDTFEPW